MVNLGSQCGLIEKSGSWYSYEGKQIAQGREAAKKYLEDRPELMEELAAKIRKQMLAPK